MKKRFVLLIALAFAGNAGAEPWDIYAWSLLGESPDGSRHYIAKESVTRLNHSPNLVSFYRKIVFGREETIEGFPVDEEVADMVIDCQSGRLDALSAALYRRGNLLKAVQYRKEHSKRVETDSLGETALRFVCGTSLPRYIREKNQPIPRGSDPR